MNYEEYFAISSEIKQLEQLLSDIPVTNVIERIGLESRLKQAQHTIAGITEYQLINKARLTFRGDPVVDSRGIFAEFATKAAAFFTDTVCTIAASLEENLRYMGPIPDKNKNQLLITGTAVGSFGFEFEIPPSSEDESNWFPDKPKAEIALEKVQELMTLASSASDDDLVELVDEIHPRAVKKTVTFLDYIYHQHAWCGLEFKNKIFRFNDLDQVSNTMERLREDNIHESEQQLTGELQGILPQSRKFEFKYQDCVIIGKIGPNIENPDILNRDYLHKQVTVKLHVIQVGQGRPKYTLQNMDNISIGLSIDE